MKIRSEHRADRHTFETLIPRMVTARFTYQRAGA